MNCLSLPNSGASCCISVIDPTGYKGMDDNSEKNGVCELDGLDKKHI